jgi:hypothetical protein
MKRLQIPIIGLLALAAAVPAAVLGQPIENPARPKAANAGRVVAPEAVLAISDEGTGEFFFKWPRSLRTAPDGSLFVIDENQVLQFAKDGGFLRNLFKKGQGPGEMQYAQAALAAGKSVVVHAGDKLVYFDAAGRFEKDMPVRPEGRTSLSLLHYLAGAFYFEAAEFPRTTGDPDVIDNPRTIVAVKEPDGKIEPLAAFVTRAWVVTSPAGGGGMFSLTSLVAASYRERFLVLTHTEDYLVKIFDPSANKVVREFRRAYDRVKGAPLTEAEKKGGMFIDGKHYTRPERKYENDVKNLLARGDEVWAVTSTKGEAKGVLVDVFDGEGTYRDAFYLKLPEAGLRSLASPGQCALDGDFVWVVERLEDETFAIKKYRLGR